MLKYKSWLSSTGYRVSMHSKLHLTALGIMQGKKPIGQLD